MYSKLKLYGHCDVNYLQTLKGSVSSEKIESAIDKEIYTPLWDYDTVTLSSFVDNLDASDISSQNNITGYSVYKQNARSNKHIYVADLSYDVTCIYDYNIANLDSYTYYISPVYDNNGQNVRGEIIQTDSIEINCGVLTVVGLNPTDNDNSYTVDESNIWSFGLNVETGDFKPQGVKNITALNGRFPHIFSEGGNYLTGSVTCYLGDISCSDLSYSSDDIELINRWRNFCMSSQIKLLRDMKGHVLICDITDTTYKYDKSFDEMPTTISFNFAEIADSSALSVYGLEE